MSGEDVLLKVDALGAGVGWALLCMSTVGPRAAGVNVPPGPESRGGEYRDGPPVFVGGGELSRRSFTPGLVGADCRGP